MDVKIENTWKEVLSDEFGQPYFEQLAAFVKEEYQNKTIYPSGKNIFRAFWKCPFDQVKVVILGQDPYHGPNQAHGLSFSVQEGIPFPPSLLNIFKELKTDLGLPIPSHGNLERWANQGVLLLNATLTVEAHKAGSHQNKGWESFTDAAIRALATKKKRIGLYAVGGLCAKKRKFYIRKRAPQTIGSTPQSAFGTPGVFGVYPLQPSQCLPERKRQGRNQMVRKNPQI